MAKTSFKIKVPEGFFLVDPEKLARPRADERAAEEERRGFLHLVKGGGKKGGGNNGALLRLPQGN